MKIEWPQSKYIFTYIHETVLSTHIWDCKARGSTYKVSWKILDRGQPFNPVTKTCKLCVRERFYILRKPHLATLNHRQEIGTFCPHVRSSLLKNIKKVKVPWKTSRKWKCRPAERTFVKLYIVILRRLSVIMFLLRIEVHPHETDL